MNTIKILATASLVLFVGVSYSTAQAGEIFLSFPDSDIVGESIDEDHVDEVRVESFSWDLLTEPGKKLETNVDISSFSLINYIDSSTASFLTKAVMGENLGRVVMKIHRTGGDPVPHVDYFILTLHDASVASVSSKTDGGQDRIAEQFVFTFSSITGVYTPVDRMGNPGTPTMFDLARTDF